MSLVAIWKRFFSNLKRLEAENSERLVKLAPKPAISPNRKVS